MLATKSLTELTALQMLEKIGVNKEELITDKGKLIVEMVIKKYTKQ